MNHDLELIRQWAHDWRMTFIPDPQKQAVELTFSRRKNVVHHPNIFFNNSLVMKVKEHKHLGIMLDSNFSFSPHIQYYRYYPKFVDHAGKLFLTVHILVLPSS